jgi:putative flippase GtrA
VTAPLRPPGMPTSVAELRALLARPLSELTTMQRFLRYFVVGGLAFVIYFSLFSAMFYVGIHYLVAGAIAFILATAFNYWLSIRFVFASGYHSRGREVVLIYLVSTLGLVINQGVLTGLVEYIGFHPIPAACGATIVVFAWNFFARHLWVFPA